MLSTALGRLANTACHTAAPAVLLCQRQFYATSSEVISKWQSILSQVTHKEQQPSPLLQAENLRQLLKDAIHVYNTEGAAAVVPDQVTEVFMGVYETLHSPQQRLTFFTLLAREFGVQSATVDAAVQLWQDKGATQAAAASPELLYRLADKLTAAAQPLYMQLLLPVSQHKAGIAFLVRLRSDLLQLLKQQPGLPQGAALRALSQDLRSALARWFSVGLLQLKRITWEDTPGQLLERVLKAEAVHHMQHMEELKRRLQQSDRRVFAFLHPSLHGEPLVVLLTAIMDHIPSSMEAVLAEPDANTLAMAAMSASSARETTHKQQLHVIQASAAAAGPVSGSSSSSSHPGSQTATLGESDSSCSVSASSVQTCTSSEVQYSVQTPGDSSGGLGKVRQQDSVACFYSISSGQPGLSGVDLGNFLIKKAAQLLLAELPQLQHLVTLSPIPGFRAWLITKLQQDAAAAASLQETDGTADWNSLPAVACQQDSTTALKHHEALVVLAACRCLNKEQQGVDEHKASPAGSNNNHACTASRGGSVGSSQRRDLTAAAGGLLELVQHHAWLRLPEAQQQQLQQVLERLCAVYLLREKRRGLALDPVQHFHLKNGAWLWRINCRADLSAAGLDRSCGLMVNYKYVLSDVSVNNKAYLVDHTIAASDSLKQLLH